MLNSKTFIRRRFVNLLQTILLIGGMALILSWSSELLFGEGVWIAVLPGIAIGLLFAPHFPNDWVMRMNRAIPLSAYQYADLYELAQRLAKAAELHSVPRLYHIPSSTMNAFTVGDKDDSAIAISDGLLMQLNLREFNGVLAHEISHVRNNDIQLMRLADLVTRLTSTMAWVGLMLAFFSLPLALLGLVSISFFGIFLLLMAPTLNSLLQFSLSRTREFAADMDAVHLTRDPEGLASALYKLEVVNRGFWSRLLRRDVNTMIPDMLRTHPDIQERIERLMALKTRPEL